MSEIVTVVLDLAKNVYQAQGLDASGRAVLRNRLRRDQLMVVFGQFPPCVAAMEACLGAHVWDRETGIARLAGLVIVFRSSPCLHAAVC